MEKLDFMKIYAFNEILKHLNQAGNDSRRRERQRVQVALKHINKWLSIGSKIYERQKNVQ